MYRGATRRKVEHMLTIRRRWLLLICGSVLVTSSCTSPDDPSMEDVTSRLQDTMTPTTSTTPPPAPALDDGEAGTEPDPPASVTTTTTGRSATTTTAPALDDGEAGTEPDPPTSVTTTTTGRSATTPTASLDGDAPSSSSPKRLQLTNGTNGFAVDFFKKAVEPGVNTVIGTYSISSALLLTMAGTSGDTTDAFGRMLGVQDMERDTLHEAASATTRDLASRSRGGLKLLSANGIFVQSGLDLRDDFLGLVESRYDGTVHVVDFAQGPTADNAVNEWVSDNTEGFIPKVVSGLAPPTVLVLANAMYLNASWEDEFELLDYQLSFTLADGIYVDADYMWLKERLMLYGDADFVAVEVPYKGEEIAMLIIEPEDLQEFVGAFTSDHLQEITEGLEAVDDVSSQYAALVNADRCVRSRNARGVGVSRSRQPRVLGDGGPCRASPNRCQWALRQRGVAQRPYRGGRGGHDSRSRHRGRGRRN